MSALFEKKNYSVLVAGMGVPKYYIVPRTYFSDQAW